MKFLKVRLRSGPGGHPILYPPEYQKAQDKFRVAGYVTVEPDLYILVAAEEGPETDALAGHADVDVLTRVEAEKFSEDNQPRLVKITDEGMVRYLEMKVRRGKMLTVQEEKALDPDDETPGFRREQILADKLRPLVEAVVGV